MPAPDTCTACGEHMDTGPSVEAFEETGIICCADCAAEVIALFEEAA